METPMKHGYIKVSLQDPTDVWIWRDGRGYIASDLWVFKDPGWSIYGISYTSGWAYFKKPLIDN